METVTLRHRSPRESSRCNRDPTSPTPAAAREKRSPEGKGAAPAALAQPLRRVTPSFPAAGVGAGVSAQACRKMRKCTSSTH